MVSKKKQSRMFVSAWLAILLVVGTYHVANAQQSSKGDLPKITWNCQSLYGGKETIGPNNNITSAWGSLNQITMLVKKRTKGNFLIRTYLPNALVKQKEMGEAVLTGSIEMVSMAGYYLSGTIPEANITPNVFFSSRTPKEAYSMVFETDWYKLVREAFAKHNLYYLAGTAASTQNIMSNVPIRRLGDFKGLRMRGGGPLIKMIEILGGVPTAIAYPEQYTALQRGTIAATFGSGYIVELDKLGEVAKYMIWPSYMIPIFVDTYVNLVAWNKLPKEYQDILRQTAEEIAKEKILRSSEQIDNWVRNELNPKYRIENIDLPKEDVEKMTQMVKPIWDDFASKSEICAKLIEIVKTSSGSR